MRILILCCFNTVTSTWVCWRRDSIFHSSHVLHSWGWRLSGVDPECLERNWAMQDPTCKGSSSISDKAHAPSFWLWLYGVPLLFPGKLVPEVLLIGISQLHSGSPVALEPLYSSSLNSKRSIHRHFISPFGSLLDYFLLPSTVNMFSLFLLINYLVLI